MKGGNHALLERMSVSTKNGIAEVYHEDLYVKSDFSFNIAQETLQHLLLHVLFNFLNNDFKHDPVWCLRN